MRLRETGFSDRSFIMPILYDIFFTGFLRVVFPTLTPADEREIDFVLPDFPPPLLPPLRVLLGMVMDSSALDWQ